MERFNIEVNGIEYGAILKLVTDARIGCEVEASRRLPVKVKAAFAEKARVWRELETELYRQAENALETNLR